MARRYSGSKGKSGSKKPIKKTKPTWLIYKPKEVELLILKLAKEGKTPSQIGLFLRDSYGIPDVKTIINKKITEFLSENKKLSQIPEDLMALIKKAVLLKKHIEENKNDMSALRGSQLTESKIKRLVKYYKTSKKLPVDWKFDPKRMSLVIE